MKTKANTSKVQPRFRVYNGEEIALGPGRVDLLEMIRETGSIAEAAEEMGMSYMRAWTLIKTTESCFKQPLVTVSRGGAKHGGATLTPHAVRVLELYRKMETESERATARTRKKLLNLLRVE
jgi:molybdate transport system regulatory protein